MLYTDYVFLFQTAGLILLVAMIGAIVLTLRDRKTSRHQNIQQQTERTVAETLQMMSVSLGAGTTSPAGICGQRSRRPSRSRNMPMPGDMDMGIDVITVLSAGAGACT